VGGWGDMEKAAKARTLRTQRTESNPSSYFDSNGI
jgi:hypothetical protein